MNPIELVWGDMKLYVRNKMCKNDQEVWRAIEEYRKTITPEKCQRFISRLNNNNI
jgi:transposase